jgi:A/G-specific adenine glycosylase
MLDFAARLIHWHGLYGRKSLPWQNTRDPYVIWISEVMLQQTQVSTVIPYYVRFLQRYPDIDTLAAAPLDDVLAQWSGLGYYSRGRNLHKAARLIVEDHGGRFPDRVDVIQRLPGIGRSTAAAIAVFAYGKHYAILDGNVKRVLARCFGMDGYPGVKRNERLLWQKAEDLLPDPMESGINRIEVYTQALMDLGATVCTRAAPKCEVCPLREVCLAFRESRVKELPSRRPGKKLPEREAILLILIRQGKILLEKRLPTGIWASLWCFPEMAGSEDAHVYCKCHFNMDVKLLPPMDKFHHTFTHFKLRIQPLPLQVVSRAPEIALQRHAELKWFTLEDAVNSAIPAPVKKLLARIDCSSGVASTLSLPLEHPDTAQSPYMRNSWNDSAG